MSDRKNARRQDRLEDLQKFFKSVRDRTPPPPIEFDFSAKWNASERALQYAAKGYEVFPIARMSKQPRVGSHGHKDATKNPEQIREWWREDNRYNIAIATTGMLVVDVDPGSEWQPQDLEPFLDCPMATTPRGGRHFFFAQTGGIKSGASVFAENVDVRAEGGYIIVAPSTVYQEDEDGTPDIDGEYTWGEGDELWNISKTDLPFAPEWLIEEIKNKSSRKNPLTGSEEGLSFDFEELEEGVQEGTRNSIAMQLLGHWLSELDDISQADQIIWRRL